MARPLTQAMRMWLWIDAFLVAAAGFQLFVLTERTDDYFAWTIGLPLTAAFLGACYWSSVPLLALAALQPTWERARVAVIGVWLFTVLTSITTFVHFDLFHTDSVFGIAWIAIYVVVPVAVVPLTLLQMRVQAIPDVAAEPLPSRRRLVLLIVSLPMVAYGALLFIAPEAFDAAWPWALTPLTARAGASWFIGIGVTILHARWENDRLRSAAAWPGLMLLSTLQFVAVARYNSAVRWDAVSTWVYVAALVVIFGVGMVGTLRSFGTSADASGRR